MELNWEYLLNDERRKSRDTKKNDDDGSTPPGFTDSRTEIERDYDRILFSTPVRRLADKTQVFPLEKNDSVRTRLTHSHEVANLARSLGVALAFEENTQLSIGINEELNPKRNLPAMLAAIGLAHDLGNPPFGHQGEYAIQAWIKKNKERIFQDVLGRELDEEMKEDFFRFEGNAQTIRLLTRLQLRNDDYGLDLTYGTLAALMKYPVPSTKTSEDNVACKKHGFFQSEKTIVKDIWEKTGLKQGVRHPLTFLMEACDDIAYSVLDVEDAVKKTLVSFSDVVSFLKYEGNDDDVIQTVLEAANKKHKDYRKENLSPNELNDITMQRFRVFLIGRMINDVKNAYLEHKEDIMKGKLQRDLIAESNSSRLYRLLKKFAEKHAYNHRSVLEVELVGYNTISKLMDYFWEAVTDREDQNEVDSKRKTPFSRYVYGRISENYRRVFENTSNDMPIRYKELQLITDMLSGMTDNFAISLLTELEKHHG